MESKILETAISEMANDQKETNKELGELTRQVRDMGEKLDTFSEKLTNHQVIMPAPDTRPITRQLAEFFEKVTAVIAAQPKNVVHQRRFLLFPADNTDYYCKLPRKLPIEG